MTNQTSLYFRRRARAISIAGIAIPLFLCVYGGSPEVLKVASAAPPQPIPTRPSQGFVNRTYLDTDGAAYPYMVFIPQGMNLGEKRPLLLYLNGYGANGNDGLSPLNNGIAHAIWENQHRFPFLVAWPQCAVGDSWNADGPSSNRLLAIMRQITEEFHTDPDRVYLSGISSGGDGTWIVAMRHPDLFAAIIPISSSFSGDWISRIAAANLPTWIYYVDGDVPLIVKANQNSCQQLLNGSISPHLTELKIANVFGKDHHNAWDFAYRDGGMYQWLARQNRRNRNTIPPDYTLVELAATPLVVESSASKSTPELEHQEMSAVRTPADAREITRLTRPQVSSQKLAELHLEFRPAIGTKRFGVGLFEHAAERENALGVLLEVAVDDLNCGGVYSWPDRKCIQSSLPVGEYAIRIGEWNDLRIKFAQGQISAELNGWQLLENVHTRLPSTDSEVGFVAYSDVGSQVEVQHLRLRRAEQTEPNDDFVNQGSFGSADRSSDDMTARMVTIETIADAWKRREQLFPHLDIRWSEGDKSRDANSLFRLTPAPNVQDTASESKALILSPDTVHYSALWQHRLVDLWRKAGVPCSPSKQDYERAYASRFTIPEEHPFGSLRHNVYCDETQRVDRIFDVTEQIQRAVLAKQTSVWRNRVGDMDDISWRGPLLAFRPLSHAGIGCQLSACKLNAEAAIIAGISCLVMEEITNVDGRELKRRFWMDPRRDFLILRSAVIVAGVIREQLDLQYAQTADQLWQLSSWTAIGKPTNFATTTNRRFPGDDWLFDVSSAKVTACHTHEAPTSSQLPVGTIVFDQTTAQWSRKTKTNQRTLLTPYDIRVLTFGDKSYRGQFSRQYSSRPFYLIVGASLILIIRLTQIGWTVAKTKGHASTEPRTDVARKDLFESTTLPAPGPRSTILQGTLALLAQLRRSRTVWISTTALLVAYLWPQFSPFWMTQKDVYFQVKQILAELEDLRSHNVDDDTWDAFQKQSSQTLATLASSLQKNAKTDDMTSMSLLWVTRDFLPIVLKDRIGSSTEEEQKVETLLRKAAETMQAPRNKPSEARKSSELPSAAIIVLNVLGACAVVGYFGRTWSSKPANEREQPQQSARE